jgi:glutathione reductase (NADPH)
VRAFLARQMALHGIELRVGAELTAIERAPDGLRLALRDGSTLAADTVLQATGRRPNTAGLGLEALGVRLDERHAIVVDDSLQTSLPGVYALGDVIDRIQLTPVALAEAMMLVDRLFGSGQRRLDYELVPTAVFTHPNVATVGLTEAQARERFGDVRVFRTDFRPLKHTLSGSAERVLMKLVVDAASDRVVGLHMVGDDAGEVVQGFAVAMKAGATKAQFDATVGIHPTAAEEFVTLREPVA